MNDDWFDELAEDNGVDPKDLSKDYDKEYKKSRPIMLKDVITKDVISNIDVKFMVDFHEMEFYPNKAPYMKYKKYEIYDIDEDNILIKEKDKYICFFHIYQMSNIQVRKGELHMNGWDYNIIYNFADKKWDEINVR